MGIPVPASGSASVEEESHPGVLQLTLGSSRRRGSPWAWPPSPRTEPLINSTPLKVMSPRALYGKRRAIVRAQKSPGTTIKAVGPGSASPAVKFHPTLLNYAATFPLLVSPPREKARPLTPPAPPSSDTRRHRSPWSPPTGRAWGRRGMTALLVCLAPRSRSPAAPAELSPAPSIPSSGGCFGTKYSLQIHFFPIEALAPRRTPSPPLPAGSAGTAGQGTRW